jgi:excisionase family DNA binding protein
MVARPRSNFGVDEPVSVAADPESSAAADLISIPEAARRIGHHTDTLYRLCRTGQFPPALQIGSRWRVSVPKLERYLHGDTADS